jgi:hypothetical protein
MTGTNRNLFACRRSELAVETQRVEFFPCFVFSGLPRRNGYHRRFDSNRSERGEGPCPGTEYQAVRWRAGGVHPKVSGTISDLGALGS